MLWKRREPGHHYQLWFTSATEVVTVTIRTIAFNPLPPNAHLLGELLSDQGHDKRRLPHFGWRKERIKTNQP